MQRRPTNVAAVAIATKSARTAWALLAARRPPAQDGPRDPAAMAAMADPKAVAAEVAKRLGMTTTTLYAYVNGDGSPKAAGQALLEGQSRHRAQAG